MCVYRPLLYIGHYILLKLFGYFQCYSICIYICIQSDMMEPLITGVAHKKVSYTLYNLCSTLYSLQYSTTSTLYSVQIYSL